VQNTEALRQASRTRFVSDAGIQHREGLVPLPTLHAAARGTVFVVDDEEPMRRALQRLFKSAGLVVEVYASAPDFLDRYGPDLAGCLVLDLMMPEMTGLELQVALSKRGSRIPIVFLTGAGQIATAVAAMKAGAVDFIEKPFDNDFLVGRIKRVLEHTSGRPSAQLGADEIARRLALLTPRELEVMRHIVAGNTSKMAARLLGVSHRTVEIHRARIMEKTQADSLADLVRIAIEAERDPRGA
jgi:FixJ family two-component response regulator